MIDYKNSCFSYSDEYTVPFVTPPSFSGTAEVGINLWVPKGRELTPNSLIKRNSGGMNIFGHGFSFSLPYFERMTTNGIPNYDLSDTFMHSVYGILNVGSQGETIRYYPQTDIYFSRIEYMADTDTFRETLRDGTVTLYTAKVLSKSSLGFIYYPSSSTGLRGTTIRYSYCQTGEISRIEYEDLPGGGYAYAIDFAYEQRRDTEKNFRGGFLYEKSLSCCLITVCAVFEEKRKLREIAFKYDNTKGYSLLSKVTETAFSGGMTETAPPIDISYQRNADEGFSNITACFEGTDIGNAVPISLYHEGACGLLSQYAFGAYYSVPVYSESHTPCFAPRVLLEPLPAGFIQPSPNAIFHRYSGNFSDLDGDGEIEWIAADGSGYYEIKDGKFGSFTPFENICPIGNKTEFADIYGDGKQSAFTVISTGEEAKCRVYRGLGRKGFGKSETVGLPEGFPAQSSLKTELSGFVRFFGDGVLHRIVLGEKSCTVFPNMGNGKFGSGISILHAPDFGEDFDGARVRFGDTTGSGTDDIIYIEQKQILIYRNIAGVFFRTPIAIPLPEVFSPIDSIYYADFSGDLLPQLIFVKRAVSGTHAYSLHFSQCLLVNGIENGYGLNVEIEHTSSARFILSDTARHRPWSSIPPYHVPVVTKLSSSDGVTGETNTAEYSYGNGRYVKCRRAIYGFGTVNEKHTTTMTLPKCVPTDLMPPEKNISTEYFIGDTAAPTAAALALIGVPLITKNIGSCGTVLVQYARKYGAVARRDSLGDSYFPALEEEETAYFGENSRIVRNYHTYDDYGNITAVQTHFLPKEALNALAEQKTEYIAKRLRTYINIDTAETLLTGVLAREVCLSGTEAAELSLASSREYYYADPVSNGELPVGVCKTPPLLHHTRDMAFSADDPTIAGLEDILLNNCGYCLEKGRYYVSGEVYEYDANRFYLTVSETLGHSLTKVSYDIYGIFVIGLERVFSTETSLFETYAPDYTALAYESKTDVNGNTEHYRYDAFGGLLALSYSNFVSEIGKPQSFEDIIANPKAYLTKGVDMFFYNDRCAWQNSKAALCRVAIIRKDREKQDGEKQDSPALAFRLSYFDSYGRGYGQAVRDTDNWIISEKKTYAKGMKIIEYPPYYSQGPCSAPSDIYPMAYTYDVLDRVSKVYSPHSEASFSWRSMEMEYKPWSTRIKDARLGPKALHTLRQDLDPRGFAFNDVCENPDGEVLRSKAVRDICGNIASVSDGRLAASGRNNMVYSYDLFSRAVKTVSADAGMNLKLYGIAGRLVYERSKGTVKTYEYDTLGRFIALNVLTGDSKYIVAEQVIWGESQPEAKENNLIGRIYEHTDLAGKVVYKKYDTFGHALAVERSYKEGKSVSAFYSYNLAGELTTATTESFPLTFVYSPAGRLSSVSMSDGKILGNFSYTAAGNVCSETGANGLHMSQNYDLVTGFITTQSVKFNETQLHKASYSFTAQGNLSVVNFETQGIQPFIASYTYDEHSRLVNATESQGAFEMKEDYVYDNGGNIVSFTRMENSVAVMTRSFEIAEDSNRVEAVVINGIRYEYSYNHQGKQEQLTTGQELTYDELGRLSCVKSDCDSEDYFYDAQGKRVSKSVSRENRSVYFTGNPLAGDYVGLSDGQEMLKLNFGGLLNSILLKTDTGMELFRQVTDQRGSVILTMDSMGNILFHEYFSPYGDAITDSADSPASFDDPDNNVPTTQGILPVTLYRFAGKEYDSGTGLYYFGARYYSPESQRMITPDDVQFAHLSGLSGLNLYAYCMGNPETFVDSTGNFPHWVKVVGELIVVGALAAGAYLFNMPNAAGAIATAGLGVTFGGELNAVTPGRATGSAAFSASVGALLTTPGDMGTRLHSAVVTGLEVAVSTAIINCGKEAILNWKPTVATGHPLATAVLTTGANIAATALIGRVDGGSKIPKMLGALGGGELGVVGAFHAGETGVITNPKTMGNTVTANVLHRDFANTTAPMPPSLLPGLTARGGAYDMNAISQNGVIDFTFYLDGLNTFSDASIPNSTEHRVIELNATEAYQWNSKTTMTDMMNVRYKDPMAAGSITTATADITVIVHGGVGGHVFIDGDAPTHDFRTTAGREKAPNHHTLVSAEKLANHLNQRIVSAPFTGNYPLIKLINCHGGEYWPGLATTAQTIADKLGWHVVGYDGTVSIKDTKTASGRLFAPRS